MVKKIAALVLILLGVVMVYLGLQAGIQAPLVTGVGFFGGPDPLFCAMMEPIHSNKR